MLEKNGFTGDSNSIPVNNPIKPSLVVKPEACIRVK
jgi:hypothetical protein